MKVKEEEEREELVNKVMQLVVSIHEDALSYPSSTTTEGEAAAASATSSAGTLLGPMSSSTELNLPDAEELWDL